MDLTQLIQIAFVMFSISVFLLAALTLFNLQCIIGHSHSLPKSATLNQRPRGTDGFVRLTKPVPPPNFEGFPVSSTQPSFKCTIPHMSEQSGIHLHSGIPDEYRRWTCGLFFQIDTTFSECEIFLIKSAVYEVSEVLCIPFFVWNPFVKPTGDYIFVANTPSEDGDCSSQVGRIGRKQIMNMGSPTCMSFSVIQHEFIHALGFLHEQSRPDRDDYVIIHWDNIIPGYAYAFKKSDDSLTFGVPYDFQSLMHYEGYAFTKNNKSTIINKETKLPVKRNYEMSSYDALKLQRMYHCDADCFLLTVLCGDNE